MERVWRIELQASGWKPEVLPLYDTRKIGSPDWTRTNDKVINSHLLYQLSYRGILERVAGIGPASMRWQRIVIPLYDTRALADRTRLELATSAVTGRCSDLIELPVHLFI